MSESARGGGDLGLLSGAELLDVAVERLLAESPSDLPEQQALDRARSIIESSERLQAARLAGIRDVDRRELFTLDAAGSTRGWLRTQLGGDKGQLSAARRLDQRPLVEAALAAGRLSGRAAEQLCAVLDKVPAQIDEQQLQGVILEGVGDLLRTYTGGLVPDDAVTPDLQAARAEGAEVLSACCADSTGTPAGRLEPAVVLLARRVSPGHLGPALRQLLEALLPDGSDGDDTDPYFFELRELLDGDVDVRGHLTPEVGHDLAVEIERRMALAEQQAKAAAAEPTEDEPAEVEPTQPEPAGLEPTEDEDEPTGAESTDPLDAWDRAYDAAGRMPRRPVEPAFSFPTHGAATQAPAKPVSTGRRRHDALGQLLHDLAGIAPGSGLPAPSRITIITTVDALEGRLGALPGTLVTSSGRPAPLTTAQRQRLACHSTLDAVLLDALGNPVGASHTRRNLTRRERRALRAQWGSTCAVAGCPNTVTVPHHVRPFWLSRITRLADTIPACEHCHHDLHDGRRTLRLRDGRLIDEFGWVTAADTVAA